MNSLGDNRSSKILFGKRKNWPLQFLRIRNPPSKLFERIFCWVKTKKEKCLEKSPSTIRRKIAILFGCFANFFTPCLHLISPQQKIHLYNTEKNSSFVDVFLEKIYKLFTRKKNPHHTGKDYQYHFTIWIFNFLVYPTVRECCFTRTFSILKFFRTFIIAHCQP